MGNGKDDINNIGYNVGFLSWATSYVFFIYCFLLLVAVYICPAVTVFPQLIKSTRTIAAIPIISMFVVGVVEFLLTITSLFSQFSVVVVSCFFVFVGTYRSALLIKTKGYDFFDWPKEHLCILILNVFLAVFIALKLGSGSFDSNDEIYSWNMWAVQHYLGEDIDFYYTNSPYPQLFSILIAYCYKLLGTIELQLPVKALFAIFSFSILTTVGLAPKKVSYENVAKYFLLAVILLFGIGVKKHLYQALADPMMVSALIVSIYLLIKYIEDPKNNQYLWLSVMCGIVAVNTKQPALIWALFSVPIIVLYSIFKKKMPVNSVLPMAILLASGLFWIFGGGSDFHQNQGVISASFQGRSFWEQLIYFTEIYLIEKPFILLLLILCIRNLMVAKTGVTVAVLFLAPALVLWFLYGSYSLRLGMHVVFLMALLLALGDYDLKLPFNNILFDKFSVFIQTKQRIILSVLVILFSAQVYISINKTSNKYDGQFNTLAGGKNTIFKYFGSDAEFVYEEIYDHKELLLWIPSNYIYGIFYGHNEVIRPQYKWNAETPSSDYSVKQLLAEIKEKEPDYLFYAGKIPYGSGSDYLLELAEQACPFLFKKVAGEPNLYGYSVYQLDKVALVTRQCP